MEINKGLLDDEEFRNFQEHLNAKLEGASFSHDQIDPQLMLALSTIHAMSHLASDIQGAAQVAERTPLVLSAVARIWGMNKLLKA